MWRADAAWECAGWDQADLLSVLIVSYSPRVPPTPPCHPLPSLKHNTIMLRNTAAGTSSVALFISPQIRKISFPVPSSGSHPMLFLWALWSHPDTLSCFTDSLCTCAVFSTQPPCSSLTLYWAPVSGCPASSALSCVPLRPTLRRQFNLSCNVMLTTGLLLLMVELCFYCFGVFFSLFCFCLIFLCEARLRLCLPLLSAH